MNVSTAAQKSDILPGRMASVRQGSVMSEDRFLSGSGPVSMITTTNFNLSRGGLQVEFFQEFVYGQPVMGGDKF